MAVKWKWNNNTGGGNVPADLANRVQTLETDNTTNKQNITNLQNDTVKLSGAQNISGVKTITATGEALKFNSGSDTSAYMSGYKSGNQRVWYFGKGSSTANDFYVGADRGTIILEASSNVHLKASNVIHCNSKKLTNVADPAANTDAATKQYVDNRIKTRTEAININANSTYTINPTSGYQIISVMVGRKRSNDGMYFFEYQTTLNKQVFLDNTTFKIYNQGNVSGFSNNEFKVVILEMKV